MSQLQHARALHLLEDNGLDPTTARYILKRLYDMGFTTRPIPDAPGDAPGLPPDAPPAGDAPAGVHPAKAERQARRAALVSQMRAEVETAKAAKAAELEAAREAERIAREAEDAARARSAAVARVLATL